MTPQEKKGYEIGKEETIKQIWDVFSQIGTYSSEDTIERIYKKLKELSSTDSMPNQPLEQEKCNCGASRDDEGKCTAKIIDLDSHSPLEQEAWEKDFDSQLEKVSDTFYGDGDGYDELKKWLRSDENKLFTEYPYPETAYEIDSDKLKQFIKDTLKSHEQSLRQSISQEIDGKIINMDSNITTDEGDELHQASKIYDRGFNSALSVASKIARGLSDKGN